MRLIRLAARGFRNLEPLDVLVPPEGFALLGPNGHGKTNVLEALCYPVLFRSCRGAPDAEVATHGGPGFAVDVTAETARGTHELSAVWHRDGREKALRIDAAPVARRTEAIGIWLTVAFLPTDTVLASGGATERRAYLDRMLALADRRYLEALSRYRSAMSQRNAALRQRQPAMARAFEGPLAEHGATIVRLRRAWARQAAGPLSAELAALGEPASAGVRYEAPEALDDATAWPAVLDLARARDEMRGATSVGPHRHDLALSLAGRPIRSFGSTGQQRTTAIALRLLELETLRAAREEAPALVLDDVFAELDADRQARLAARLAQGTAAQVFVSAPRHDELPAGLHLATWHVTSGRVQAAT